MSYKSIKSQAHRLQEKTLLSSEHLKKDEILAKNEKLKNNTRVVMENCHAKNRSALVV